MMTKVGRNDPCPCGSGKKFKKCCAQKSSIQRRSFTNLTAQQDKISGMASKTIENTETKATEDLTKRIGQGVPKKKQD